MKYSKFLMAIMFVSAVGASSASAAPGTVTVKPTLGSVPAGHSVLYNDGHCPSGQIGKYKHAAKKEELKKTCVHI